MRKALYIGILILVIACLSVVPIMYNLQDVPESLPQALSASSELLPDDGSYTDVPKKNNNTIVSNKEKIIYTAVSIAALVLIGVGYLFLRRRLKKRRPKEERQSNRHSLKHEESTADNSHTANGQTVTDAPLSSKTDETDHCDE